MNNVCEKLEKIEFKLIEDKPSLMDLYKEMNRLKRENEILKANNYELQKENNQLRNDNQELHNRINENIEENEYTTMVDGNDDLSYMDEYAKGNEELEIELAKRYEVAGDDYKFGGHDIKTNEQIIIN